MPPPDGQMAHKLPRGTRFWLTAFVSAPWVAGRSIRPGIGECDDCCLTLTPPWRGDFVTSSGFTRPPANKRKAPRGANTIPRGATIRSETPSTLIRVLRAAIEVSASCGLPHDTASETSDVRRVFRKAERNPLRTLAPSAHAGGAFSLAGRITSWSRTPTKRRGALAELVELVLQAEAQEVPSENTVAELMSVFGLSERPVRGGR